jgi:hypothetical protein
VRNVLTDEKLLKLFAKFLMEATAGGSDEEHEEPSEIYEVNLSSDGR